MRARHPVTRRLLPLTAALACAAAVTASCTRTERATPASNVKTAEANAPAAATVAPASPHPASAPWALGLRYAYDVRLTTAVALGTPENAFDFDVLGRLELEAAKLEQGAVTLQASFSDAKIVSRLPAAQSELDRLAAELRHSGIFFTLDAGKLAALFVPPGMSTTAASTYRQLAAALQFAASPHGQATYSTEEFDTTGQYLAEYTAAGGDAWHKQKLRYLTLLAPAAPPSEAKGKILPEVVASNGELTLSPDGRPLVVKLSDRLAFANDDAKVRSSSVLELTNAGAPRVSPSSAERLALLAKLTRVAAGEPLPAPKSSDDNLDDAKLGGLDYATILAHFDALGARATARAAAAKTGAQQPPAKEQAEREAELREEAHLFQALAVTFRREPARAIEAAERVRAGSPLANHLIDALGSAATPEAHRTLGKLALEPKLDVEHRGRAVFALARTTRPSDAAVSALKGVLEREPFNTGALYGLGTYSRWYRDAGDATRAAALGEFLVARLPRARGPMSLGDSLRALANAGYAAALPRVMPYLDDERDEVRAAAVRALQAMPDARVDGIIAARLRTDASPDVRLAAIEAAKLRSASDTLAAALADQSVHAEDSHVRFRAVELMADWLATRPSFRATLEQVANNDAEPKIRERAHAAL
jgi:hypothetical protein